jgi:hypothetical protein
MERIAAAQEAMVIRAKVGALLVMLLAGFLFLFGGTNQACAHAGHDHGSARTRDNAIEIPTAHRDQGLAPLQRGFATPKKLAATPDGPTLPLHQANCCCGSVACHAGVGAPTANISDPYRVGERLALPPARVLTKTGKFGIERPPRKSSPA